MQAKSCEIHWSAFTSAFAISRRLASSRRDNFPRCNRHNPRIQVSRPGMSAKRIFRISRTRCTTAKGNATPDKLRNARPGSSPTKKSRLFRPRDKAGRSFAKLRRANNDRLAGRTSQMRATREPEISSARAIRLISAAL